MPTLETLERAASSLGYAAAQKKPGVLEVNILRTGALEIRMKDGTVRTRAQFGFLKEPWDRAAPFLAAVVVGFFVVDSYVLRARGSFGLHAPIVMMVAAALLVGFAFNRWSLGRARKRLFDRAYDMERATAGSS